MTEHDVLDRLEKLLGESRTEFFADLAYINALRNAAPALIRLARLAERIDKELLLDEECYDKGISRELHAAIKALGEVAL